MRRTLTSLTVLLAIAGTPMMAGAHSGKWTWTTAKAERMVVSQATVRLPTTERESLMAEIKAAQQTVDLAELIAKEGGDAYAIGAYQDLAYRLYDAYNKVRDGLPTASATCAGTGKAVKARHRHFRCSATSQMLGVPSVTLSSDGVVVEGATRFLGPLQAQLDVHVRGTSKLSYSAFG